MNKCDLEETRKQIDDLIAGAFADPDGWGRAPYQSDEDGYSVSVFLARLKHSSTHLCAVRYGGELKPTRAEQMARQVFRGSHGPSKFYTYFTESVEPQEKRKRTPTRWALSLNGMRVGTIKRSDPRFAVLQSAQAKCEAEAECQRLLRALTPPKMKPGPAPESPKRWRWFRGWW